MSKKDKRIRREIQDIFRSILEKNDLSNILERITSTIGTLFGYKRVVLTLWDENFNVQHSTHYGLSQEEVQELEKKEMTEEERRIIMDEKYKISNSYFVPEEDNPLVTKALPGRSVGEWRPFDALIVPLWGKERIIGWISLDEPISGKRPTEEDLRDIEIFADQASIAIENEKMVEREEEFIQKLKILNKISREFSKLVDLEDLFHKIPELIKETYNLPFVGLGIFDGENIVFRHYSTAYPSKSHKSVTQNLEEGLIGWAARNKKTLYIKDVSKDPRYLKGFEETRSELAIPLVSEGELLGVMDFQSDEIDYFTSEDILVLENLTDQIAISLRNSQLFKKLQNEKKLHELFISVLSHDLKTPLQVILGYADLFGNEKYASAIERNVKKITAALEKAHTYTKLEAGYKENLEKRDIKSTIESLMSDFGSELKKKNIEIDLDLEETFIESFGVLENIFQNLIENSIKYSPENSKIEIYSEDHDVNVVVNVKNYGPTIPDDMKEVIFERFKRTDHRTPGTGLGLAIVKKAVSLHEGVVWVEDTSDGGTVFKVKLPKNLENE